MPAVFPPALPPLTDAGSLSGQTASGALRTEMSHGPAKVRRRTTATPKPRRMGSKHYTRADLAALLDFHETTLGGGVLPFEMTDPVTEQTANMRFVGEIDWRPRNRLKYSVSVNLEILP
jgi:hypothetical protein